MTYQDKWVRGMTTEKGYRECASRYELVRAFCGNFNGPFTVADIGANMCYFGLRLTEDFPQCTVLAFEFHQYEMRQKYLKTTGYDPKRLVLFNRKVTLEDMHAIGSCCQFDVVLAMSVMHHLSGQFDEWLAAFKRLGRNVIAEFAMQDSPRVALRNGYHVPVDAIVLGECESHKQKGTLRPIVLIQGDQS